MKNKPRFPILTTISGVLWIVFGVLYILATILFIIFSLSSSFGRSLFSLSLIAFPATLGVVFIYIGVQTIRRKAHDVVIPSIFSILIGALYLFPNIQMNSRVNSAIFFLAGILALIGRKQYKEWRNARMQNIGDSKKSEE